MRGSALIFLKLSYSVRILIILLEFTLFSLEEETVISKQQAHSGSISRENSNLTNTVQYKPKRSHRENENAVRL